MTQWKSGQCCATNGMRTGSRRLSRRSRAACLGALGSRRSRSAAAISGTSPEAA
jgi:hypothetical protein